MPYEDLMRQFIIVLNNKTTYAERFDYIETRLIMLLQEIEKDQSKECRTKYLKDIRFVIDCFFGVLVERGCSIIGVSRLWSPIAISNAVKEKVDHLRAEQMLGVKTATEDIKNIDEAYSAVAIFGDKGIAARG